MRREPSEIRIRDFSRILICGPSGSGKSTLAKTLAAKLGVNYIDIDRICHLPNWVDTPVEQAKTLLEDAVSAPGWVLDGNYSKLRHVFVPRAELVIWLDYPFPTVFRQLFGRTFHRVRTKTESFPGCQETWKQVFFSKESILLWLIQTHRLRHRQMLEFTQDPEWAHLAFISFSRPRELREWLKAQSIGA